MLDLYIAQKVRLENIILSIASMDKLENLYMRGNSTAKSEKTISDAYGNMAVLLAGQVESLAKTDLTK